MKIFKFINREEEIKKIKDLVKTSLKGITLGVVYGRRRVGKTRLIQEATKMNGHKVLYFYVDKKPINLLLDDFCISIEDEDVIPKYAKFDSFDRFLGHLLETGIKKPLIIIFDEFQNFNYVYPAAYSVVQKWYDHYHLQFKGTDTKALILMAGSYVGMMKRLFGYREPLYGRSNMFTDLKQFKFKEMQAIFDQLSINDFEERVKIYSVLGGIPKYYEFLSLLKIKNFSEMLSLLFVEEPALLKNEIKDILLEEFGRDYKMYFSLLEAIANGKTKITEIANFAGIPIKNINRFLYELIDVYDLVKRFTLPTEKKAITKKNIYLMEDNLTNFWFKYVYRNFSLFEFKEVDKINKLWKKDINSFIGKRFEKVCREFLINLYKKLPVEAIPSGPWWGYARDEFNQRKVIEIDLIGMEKESKKIMFVECKWQDNVNAENVLENLKKKAQYVQWNNEERKEYFAIFAKSFKKKIKKENLLLFDLKDIEKIFKI